MTKPIERQRLVSLLDTLLPTQTTARFWLSRMICKAVRTHRTRPACVNVEVIEARNGREAVTWLSNHPTPGMILLDLLMPEMDGFSYCDAN